MHRPITHPRLLFGALAVACCSLLALPAIAGDPAADAHKGFRLEPALLLGDGSDDSLIGATTTGERVTLSGGGGVGGTLTFGYGMKNVEFDVSVGLQESDLSQRVSNASGDFTRNHVLGTVKFRKFFSDNHLMKFGGGVGLYMAGESDIDLRQVPVSRGGGFREIIEFDDSVGYHVMAEYERYFGRNWSWLAGLKFYDVDYDAERCTVNGVLVPIEDLRPEMRQFDGTGVDLIVGLGFNFG